MAGPDFIPVQTSENDVLRSRLAPDFDMSAPDTSPNDFASIQSEIGKLAQNDPRRQVLANEQSKMKSAAPDFLPVSDTQQSSGPDFIPVQDDTTATPKKTGIMADLDEATDKSVQQLKDFGNNMWNHPADTIRGAAVGLAGMIPQLGTLVQGANPNFLASYIQEHGHVPSATDLQDEASKNSQGLQNALLSPSDPSAGPLIANEPAVKAGIEGPSAPFNVANVPGQTLTKAGYPQIGAMTDIATNLGMLALGGKHGEAGKAVDPAIAEKNSFADQIRENGTIQPQDTPTPPQQLSPEQVAMPAGSQMDLPFNSDITGGQKELFPEHQEAPIPAAEIAQTLQQVPPDVLKAQEYFTRQTTLADAEKLHDFSTQDLSETEKAKQMDEMWAMNKVSDYIQKQDSMNLQQQMIDQGFEDNRPTSMSDAFQRAMQKQRGSIDPDMLGMGAMADAIKSISEKFQNPVQRIGALLDKFRGTFGDDAIQSLQDGLTKSGKDVVAFMKPQDFEKYTSKRDVGYSSETASKYKSINEGLNSDKGLDDVPTLYLGKTDDGMTIVRDHDGRHRSDILAQRGMEAMPVKLSFDDGYDKDNAPQVIKSQSGEVVPMPKIFNYAGTVKADAAKALGEQVPSQGGFIKFKNFYDPEKNKRGRAMDLSAFFPGSEGSAKTQALLGRFDINGTQFVKAFQKTFGNEGLKKMQLWYQDFGSVTTSSFRAVNRYITDPANLQNLVLKFWDDKIHLGKEEEHGLNEVVRKGFKPYEDYYNIGVGDRFRFKMSDYKNDVSVAVKMEKDPTTWFDGKNYIPTVEQMQKAGMTPGGAKAWLAVHNTFDTIWGTLAKASAYAGVHMPERIPGYIPHIFKGPYKVVLKDMTDPANPTHISEYNYYSQKAAESMLENNKHVLDGNPGYSLELEIPETIGKNTASMINGIWDAKTLMDKNAGLTKLLDTLYEGSVKGIVSSVLDRANITKAGHLLSRINEPGQFGLKDSQVREAAKMIKVVAQDVNGWYARTKFVNETLFPLDAVGMLSHDKTRNAAKNYMESFFGIPDKFVPDLDWIFRDDAIKAGMDPGIWNALSKNLRSGFSKYYLFFKAPFYATNSLQFTLGLGHIFSVKAMSLVNGEKAGSIMKMYNDLALNKDGSRLNQIAMEKGHADPEFMEQMDPGQIRDPIAVGIERQTRLTTFKMGYHYYKQIMPEEAAIHAAGAFGKTISVPYSAEVGQPVVINRLPTMIKPLVLFSTYNAHMISLASQGFRILSEAVSSRNPSAIVHAMAGLASVQAINVGLFGLGGLVMTKEYNDITKFINETFGTAIPDTTWMARKIAGWAGTKGDVLENGALSRTMGYDVSGSGQGANMSMPLAGLDAIKSIGEAAILALRYAGSQAGVGQKPSKAETWEWAKTMPSQWRGAVEYMIKEPSMKDMVSKLYGETKDWSVGHNSQGGQDINALGLPRTHSQTIIHALTGMIPNQEAEANKSLKIEKQQKAEEEFDAGKTIQRLKEGNMSQAEQSKAILMLSQKWWKDPGSIIDQMINAKMNQSMSDEQRRGMGATKDLESMEWYDKWQKNLATEPSRKP